MQVLIGFIGLVFVAALWRPEGRSPRASTLLFMAILLAGALLSHKVA